MEAAFARIGIAVANQGLESVGGAFEPAVRKFRGAYFLAQRKGGAKNGKAMFAQVGFDRGAEARRIVRQNTVFSHESPGFAAIQKTVPDAVLGDASKKACQFIRCLQAFAPSHTFLR